MKMAIVGCEASGKTVFMSALADYFGRAAADNPMRLKLIPENAAANSFERYQFRQMRCLRQWPPATPPDRTIEMKWTLRHGGKSLATINLLEFGGETYRAAFRDDAGAEQKEGTVAELFKYLGDADFFVVLISIKALLANQAELSIEDFDRETESLWISHGILKFITTHRPKAGIVIGLTQADRYRNEIGEAGGARSFFAAHWPTVAAAAEKIPVVEVSSVSKTDADGNPADGYNTHGILPVMRIFAKHCFGNEEALENGSIAPVIPDEPPAAPAPAQEPAAPAEPAPTAVTADEPPVNAPLLKTNALVANPPEEFSDYLHTKSGVLASSKKNFLLYGAIILLIVGLLAALIVKIPGNASQSAAPSVTEAPKPLPVLAVTNTVEKIVKVEKPVTNTIEKIVKVEKPVTNTVEKIVRVEKIVEKPVEKLVEVEKVVTNTVKEVVEVVKPVEVEKVVTNTVKVIVEKVVTNVVEKAQPAPQKPVAQNPAETKPAAPLAQLAKTAAVKTEPSVTISQVKEKEKPDQIPPGYRIWTDYNGRKIIAKWTGVAVDESGITIVTRFNRRIDAVLWKFSAEDQAYIKREIKTHADRGEIMSDGNWVKNPMLKK